jgi:hypothetical protein
VLAQGQGPVSQEEASAAEKDGNGNFGLKKLQFDFYF